MKSALLFTLLSAAWILAIELYLRPSTYLKTAFEHYSQWQIYLFVPLSGLLGGACCVLLGSMFRTAAGRFGSISNITAQDQLLPTKPTKVVASFARTAYFLGGRSSLVWSTWFHFNQPIDTSKKFEFLHSPFLHDNKIDAESRLRADIKTLYSLSIQTNTIENIPVNTLEDVVRTLSAHPNDHLVWHGVIKCETQDQTHQAEGIQGALKSYYLTWACLFERDTRNTQVHQQSPRPKALSKNIHTLSKAKPALETIEYTVQEKLGHQVTVPAPLLLSLWLNKINFRRGQTIEV
jgi:hypothetical protein